MSEEPGERRRFETLQQCADGDVCNVCRRPTDRNQPCLLAGCIQLRQALAMERIADTLEGISSSLDRLGDLTQYGAPT